MRTFLADGDPPATFCSRIGEYDFADRPVVARLNAIAGAMMELLGPMFWAALVVLLVQAELSAG
jgi:hypothetical protein